MTEIEIAEEDELMAMLVSPDPAVRRQAAESPFATEDVLLAALEAETPEEFDYSFLDGDHPHPDAEMDCRFAEARAAACRNPNATEKVLLRALQESDFHGYASVAAVEHPDASGSVLLAGIASQDIIVQTSAAANPNASEKVLITAMKHCNDDQEDFHLRMTALLHPNASLDVILLGLDDRYFEIQLKATERLQQCIRLLSGKVKDPEWIFVGLEKNTGLYVFRRCRRRGGERIGLTRAQLRQAVAYKHLRMPVKGGRLRQFFASVTGL